MLKKNPVPPGPGRLARTVFLMVFLGLLFCESTPVWSADVTVVTLTTIARSVDNTVAELATILVDVALISGSWLYHGVFFQVPSAQTESPAGPDESGHQPAVNWLWADPDPVINSHGIRSYFRQ